MRFGQKPVEDRYGTLETEIMISGKVLKDIGAGSLLEEYPQNHGQRVSSTPIYYLQIFG